MTLKSFLTKVFKEGIFIDTHSLYSKAMAIFKDDPIALSSFITLALEFVGMGYVDEAWDAVRDIPFNDFESYHKFVRKFLKKGNAKKVGDIATLHYTGDKKIQLIQILLGTTKIASLYIINIKEEEIGPLALRIAASLPEDSKNKWSEIIVCHFGSWKSKKEILGQEEELEKNDKQNETQSTCLLS